jgi:hypothetical protein
LLFQDLQDASGHFARAADQSRELLPAHFDLHPLGVRHRVRLSAQIHDCVRHPAGDIDEREVAEFAVGPIEPRRELSGQFKDEPRTLRSDLPKARISHFCELGLLARAHPGAARRLFVEQAHFPEKLALVQVSEHHFVAVFVLDHDFDGTADDVVENVRQVPCMDDYRLGRDCPDSAVAQETIDRWDIA